MAVHGQCASCSGNHYVPVDSGFYKDFAKDGGKEFWTCCKCHSHYTSIYDIPGYNTKNWASAPFTDETFETFEEDDDRFSKKCFNGSEISHSNKDNVVDINGTNGFELSKSNYGNISFDVCVNYASSYNPYSDHDVRNSILIGASVDSNGKLHAYAIDICTAFIDVFYLYGHQTVNHAGNSIDYASGNFSSKTLSISVNSGTLLIKEGETTLINTSLTVNNYWDRSSKVGNISYQSGKVGYLNYDSTTASCSFSNFNDNDNSKTVDSLFGPRFSLNSNSILSNNSKGYMITSESFSDVQFDVKVNQASTYNPYEKHDLRNSILIGASVDSDGKLRGYAIDICTAFIDVFYLYGNETVNHAGNAIAYASGDFSNKTLTVSVNSGTLLIKEGGTPFINKNLAISGYKDGGTAVGNISYQSGKVGYLNYDSLNGECTFSDLKTFDNPLDSISKQTTLNGFTIDSMTKKLNYLKENDGYVLSKNKYTNFKATINVSTSAKKGNCYFTYISRNAFLFGTTLNNNVPSGYLVEFYQQFIMLFKYSGDTGFGGSTTKNTDECIAYIENNDTNKEALIEVNNKNIKITAYSTKNNTMEVINADITDYTEGMFGYLKHDENNMSSGYFRISQLVIL